MDGYHSELSVFFTDAILCRINAVGHFTPRQVPKQWDVFGVFFGLMFKGENGLKTKQERGLCKNSCSKLETTHSRLNNQGNVLNFKMDDSDCTEVFIVVNVGFIDFGKINV